jgi:hypothetical protein
MCSSIAAQTAIDAPRASRAFDDPDPQLIPHRPQRRRGDLKNLSGFRWARQPGIAGSV